MRFDIKEDGKRILMVCVASLIMALNIKTFVRTGGLYPGGATGLTILIQRVADLFFGIAIPYTLVNVILNAIPVYIGFRFIGKKFTLYSCLMILLTGILTDLIPGYPNNIPLIVSEDGFGKNDYIPTERSLIVVTAPGAVISLCLFANATSGGTDFIAIYLSEKKGMDSWNLVLGLNVLILGAAGLLFGWDKALYSIIFQYASTQMINMMYKRYDKDTLFIITKKPDEVYNIILKKTNHDATLFKGVGCYKNEEKAMLYSVVNSDATRVVIMDIKKEDPDAFINYFGSKGIRGKFYYQEEE